MPSATICARSRFVAAMTRTSTGSSRAPPTGRTRLLLQDAQQARLHLVRHLADLVEQDGAAVGLAEEALAIAVGAGERAAHVAEELALEEVRRDGAAVDAEERPLRARARRCGRPRDDLLAGAALAGDEHRDVGVLHAVDERVDAAHRARSCRRGPRSRSGSRSSARTCLQVAARRRRAARCACRAARASSSRARRELHVRARQLVGARAVLGEQARVLDGDRHLIGERAERRQLLLEAHARAQRASRGRARRWCGRAAARRGWGRTRSTGS